MEDLYQSFVVKTAFDRDVLMAWESSTFNNCMILLW